MENLIPGYLVGTEDTEERHKSKVDYSPNISKVYNEDCPKISRANVTKIMVNSNETKDLPPSLLVTKGVNKFGTMLFEDLENSTNLVFSPFSLSTALAMLAPGAKGNTLKQVFSW